MSQKPLETLDPPRSTFREQPTSAHGRDRTRLPRRFNHIRENTAVSENGEVHIQHAGMGIVPPIPAIIIGFGIVGLGIFGLFRVGAKTVRRGIW